MAQDRNGNNHKAAGRPDGGQFDRKAGQGSDDDLDFEVADTRLSAAVPDMDAEDRRGLVDVVIGGLDEDDPVAVAGYLDSLDPGVRFFLSDKARALEARTLDDPDWCDAHAEELMAAVPDISAGALTGVIRYWRADDPGALTGWPKPSPTTRTSPTSSATSGPCPTGCSVNASRGRAVTGCWRTRT